MLAIVVGVRYFNKHMLERSKDRMKLTDARSSRVAELVQKIRHVKMAGLEPLLQKEIEEARQKECSDIGQIFMLRAAFDSLMDMMPTVGVMLILAMSYAVSGQL